MAENRKSINELTELPGNLSPNALLAIVQGGVTYHATGQQVIDAVNTYQGINYYRRYSPNAIISAGGAVAQFDGRIELIVTKDAEAGHYTITNAESRIFETAIITGEASGTLVNSSRVMGLGTSTISVRIYGPAFVLTNIAFQIQAELAAP